MKRLLILSLFTGTLVSVGCVGLSPKGWYEPEFQASYSPIWGLSVRSTRDDAANLNASYNPETKELHLEAQITSSASEVNKSQEKLMELMNRKMEILVDEMRVHGDNIERALGQFGEMFKTAAAPFTGASLDVDGPLGKGGIKTGGGQPASESSETNERLIQQMSEFESRMNEYMRRSEAAHNEAIQKLDAEYKRREQELKDSENEKPAPVEDPPAESSGSPGAEPIDPQCRSRFLQDTTC